MASLTQWMWVWASSGRWWRTGKPGMLQSIGSQRVGHDWVTKQLNFISTRFGSDLFKTQSQLDFFFAVTSVVPMPACKSYPSVCLCGLLSSPSPGLTWYCTAKSADSTLPHPSLSVGPSTKMPFCIFLEKYCFSFRICSMKLFLITFFWGVPCGLWDLNFLTRDWTRPGRSVSRSLFSPSHCRHWDSASTLRSCVIWLSYWFSFLSCIMAILSTL